MNRLKDFFDMEPFDAIAYKAYLSEIKAERFVISMLLKKDNKIIRTRVNDKAEVFDTFEDLKYPPIENARTDRASIEGKPMFYGCVFTHKGDDLYLPRIIGLMEASAFFRDTTSIGGQFLTQSAWGNNRDLKLAMLPTSSMYTSPSDELKYIQKEYNNIAQQLGVVNNSDARYLGDLLAQENVGNTYNLTAYYIDYLLNESEDGDYFDGVIYPSVPSEGLGMNICIRKELIDSGEVECDGACFEALIKYKKECKLIQIFDADILSNGRLVWRKSKMLNKAIASPSLFQEMFSV